MVTEKIKEHRSTETDVSGFEYKPKIAFEIVKRIFDFFVSLICIIILAIPFAIISLMIIIDDHKAGPIFVQERVGKHGKPFKIYKRLFFYFNGYSFFKFSFI